MINEIIKKRKSIRNYDPKRNVSDEQIKELLAAAMLAPSACNLRPWEFIAINNRDILNKITNIHPHTQMLKTASCAILVCGLPTLQKGRAGEGMWQHDCGAATENILLQAASMDLGTCWCGLHPVERLMNGIRELFELPETVVPFSCIAVGYPAEEFGGRGYYDESKVRWIE